MALGGGGGEAVGDDDGEVVGAMMRRERRCAFGTESATEVWAHEVGSAVLGLAGDADGRGWEGAGERRFVEWGMDGIAGAGLGEAELQQRPGREGGTGAGEADAGGGEALEIVPIHPSNIILRRCSRRRQERLEVRWQGSGANLTEETRQTRITSLVWWAKSS